MDHNIGAALPFQMFEKQPSDKAKILIEAFGGVQPLLSYCAHNLSFVELRSINKDSDPDTVLDAVRLLRSQGISVTIHGTLDETDAFFAPYSKLLCHDLQSHYNITVHPLKDADTTVDLLAGICDRIEENGYPFFIALENQRLTPKKTYGCCEEIAAVVHQINSPHLGICFDFGHQLSNEKRGLPDHISDRFLSRVRHTHIHSLYEERTHFPLDHGETALDRNLTALFERCYTGVLSLELSPQRYKDKFDVKASMEHSVSILRSAATLAQRKKEVRAFYDKDYLDTLCDLKQRFDAAENCIALVGPSAYVMKFGGTCVAVDVAPSVLSVGKAERQFLLSWIGGFDAYILTHAHTDHYDADFFDALPAAMRKLVPDFMQPAGEGIIHTRADMKINVNDLELGFFNSRHSHGTAVIPEYGFYIEYRGQRFVFPVDVRDYDYVYPTFDNVRMVFAHLWLGKAMALDLCGNPYLDRFCRFAAGFHAEECYLAHLNDFHRKIENMWSDIHATAVCQRLKNAKPFSVGDLIEITIPHK